MYRTNYLTPVSMYCSHCVSDKARLRQYLIEGYQEEKKLNVTLLPDWVQLHVCDIFTPVVLVDDKKLGSYKEMFYKDNELQRRVFLLGKAGAGKTTFSKHLTDVWCKSTITPQFTDVEVLQRKEFQFLFYVSCRFATERETLL